MIQDEVRQLLEELHRRPGMDAVGDRGRLRRLGDLGEVSVLSALLPLALYPSLSLEVVACLRRLLERRPAALVCRLDGMMRAGGQVLHDWYQLSLARLQELADLPEGEWLVAAVCSHRNGRLREWAVRRLGEAMHSGGEIAYLVTRLNDWVGPVRQAAASALESRLVESRAASLVECLPFLERIPGRPDQLTLLERIRAFVSRPDRLEFALNSPDRTLRLSGFRASHLDEELVRRALQDPDQSIQAWATRQLARLELSPSYREELLKHPRAAARRSAILGGPGLSAEQTDLLLDNSRKVRAAAQGCFPDLDVAEFYRRHLPQKAALAGLGETGRAEDARLLLPFCRHSRVAVRALARLDREGQLEELLALLCSGPGLAKEAFGALIPLAGRLTRRLLGLVGDPSTPSHGRDLALDLLERGDKWESLPLLLELRQLALLQRWWQHYNRRQVPPKPEQLQRARRALADLQPGEFLELRKLLQSLG